MAFDLDKYLQHQLYLERLATGNINSILLPQMSATQKAIARILNEHDVILNARELNQITRAITEQINSETAWTAVTENMEEMAVYEAKYMASLSSQAFAAAISLPKDSKIVDYVSKAIISLTSGKRVDAGVWSQFTQANKDGQAKFVNSIVADGYSKGQTSNQMNKRIRDGYNGILKRDAETLARTGFISYAAEANNAMIDDNIDVLDEYYYITVFDNRTSDICIAVVKFNELDNRYKVGDPKAPNPPLHYNAIAEGGMVKTIDGDKKIENVKVGDYVLTHKGNYKKVLTVMRKPNDTNFVRVIRTKSGRVVRMTDEHPTLVSGKGWIRADEIKVGDNLFESISKKTPVAKGLPVAEVDPYNYPSLFDGEEVFFKVSVKSGDMASAINLDNDLAFDVSEISDGVTKDELMRKIIQTKKINKRCLSNSYGFSEIFSQGIKHLCLSGFIMNRVVSLHSLGMSFMRGASFFSKPVSPVVSSDTNTIINSDFSRDTLSVSFTHGLNAMNSTPSTHSAVSKRKLSFYGSKRLFKLMIMKLKKASEKFFAFKFFHWNSSVVSCISIVEYNKDVYNLEVEDDNTYLVDNCVVHNCRTRRLGVTKGWQPLGDKGSVGGKSGEVAEKSFERREDRSNGNTVKYRGKNDKAFKAQAIKATTTRDAWLKKQPDWFIYDLLGKGKGDLFLSGKPLSSFSDLTGKPLTLKQIKARDGLK